MLIIASTRPLRLLDLSQHIAELVVNTNDGEDKFVWRFTPLISDGPSIQSCSFSYIHEAIMWLSKQVPILSNQLNDLDMSGYLDWSKSNASCVSDAHTKQEGGMIYDGQDGIGKD